MATISPVKILKIHKEAVLSVLAEADEEFVKQLVKNKLLSSKNRQDLDNLTGEEDPRLRARYLLQQIDRNMSCSKKGYNNCFHTLNYVLSQFKFSANFALFLQNEISGTVTPTLVQQQVILNENHISMLIEILAECSHKWREIAIALRLSTSVIDECGLCRSNKSRLHYVLINWHRKTNSACLKDVQNALKSKNVGLLELANSLRATSKDQIIPQNQTVNQPRRTPTNVAEAAEGKIEVVDSESTLLGVNVPYSEPASYQWMKDGQNLTDDLDYSGVQTDTLLIRQASQGLGGKYTCKINFEIKPQTQRNYELCIKYSPSKKCLLERYTKQTQVPTDSWPPVGVSKYIELALIQDEKISKMNDCYIRGDVDDILRKKEISNYEDLFTTHIEGGLVLVEGRPGSGKTTLTHKLVRDWAKGPHILKGSKLVFLVSLRMLSSTGKDKTLSDILEMFYNKEHLKQVTEMIERSHGEGVCFIIDGLDEYHSQGSVITKLLDQNDPFLCKAMVIVVSRPIGTAKIRQGHPNSISKRIEVFGFTKAKISKYIHQYNFNSGSAAELEAYLQRHINVFHMCYLPVHTAMICYIYDVNGDIPNTETKIYEIFTLLTIKRKLEVDGSRCAPQSLRELDGILKKCFVDICRLAFEMTINSTQIISQGKTFVCLSDWSSCDMYSLGLVTVDATAKLLGFEDLYTLLHLTFQEYLAACHVAAQDEDEQTRIIEQHKDKKEMWMVWKFYSGMKEFIHSKNKQFKLILQSMSTSDIHKVQCAFESQQPSVCPHILQDNSLAIKDHVFTPVDYHAINFVVSKSNSEIKFTLENCIMDETGILFDSHTLNSIKSITFINEEPKQYESLFYLLQNIPSIEYLSINPTQRKALRALTSISITQPNLEVLRIAMPFAENLTCSEIEYFLKNLMFNSSSLKLVQYHYCSSGHESHQQSLSHLLATFKCAIEPLSEIPEDVLSNRNVTFSRVTRFLCLTTLKLTNCNMNDSDAHYLLDSGINYESLRLDVNRITDNGAVLLSDVVRRCPGLKCLSLSCNEIGDEGAMALAAVLHGSPSLMELDLQCNAIGDEGAVAIARAVKDFPQQFQLSLCNSKVTPEGTENVLKYRPTATIKGDK